MTRAASGMAAPRPAATLKRHCAGTHRLRSPEATWADYARFMQRAGITRLANVTGLDFIGVPVYMAVRPNSRTLAVSQGKGTSAMAAKVSALMEGLECWHAETVERPCRQTTWRALREAGEATIDLDAVHEQLPRAAPPDVPRAWLEGHDLLAQRSVWVPFDLVSVDFRYPPGAMPAYPQHTNGLASGNHPLEAITHGAYELIERDAATLWFLDQASNGKERQIDLATVDDAESRLLIERVRRAGLELGVYDITSDVGVATIACVLFDSAYDMARMGYFWGFGTHLDRGVALSRAVSEAIQCRLTEITGTRDDIPPDAYRKNRGEEELEALRALVLDEPPARDFAATPSCAGDSFEEDLERICAALRAAGIAQLVSVDLTKPDVGIPVVRTLAPALEGPPFEHTPGKRAARLLATQPADQE